jgi:hypothetical protein
VYIGFAVETRETKMETNVFPPPGGGLLLANPGTTGNEITTGEIIF